MNGVRSSLLWVPLVIVFALVVLSSCGTADLDVTLQPEEQFEIEMTATAPVSALALLGGEEALEQQLEESAEAAAAENIALTWRKARAPSSGEVAYVITMTGAGYSMLSNLGMLVEPIEYDGRDALSFSFDSNYVSSESMEFEALTLHAGEVLETNGEQTGRGTVVWENPSGTLTAIVTPASQSNTSLIVVLAVVAVAAIAAFVLYRMVRSRRPAPATVATEAGGAPSYPASVCGQCGAPLQPGAKFCMQCGQPTASQ